MREPHTLPDRLLVVVAHPDDETFGCGSLLAHSADRGVAIVVACATRGEAGDPAPGSGIGVGELPKVREAELRGAAQMLGVDDVVLWDWADSGMDGDPPEGSLCAADLDDVAAIIAATIDDVAPTVVVTLDGSDGHRDHVHIRAATTLAVERATHQVTSLYLHCLPQVLMREWVAALTVQHPESDHLHLGELGTPAEQVTTIIDTTDLLARREAAIAHHRSQTSPYEVMDAELRRSFLTAEHLQRIRPAWTGGEVETALHGFEASLTPRGDRGVPTPG